MAPRKKSRVLHYSISGLGVHVVTLLTFAGGDAVFKMTAPYHRTVASYDFFNDYRGYFIVSFEFRRPEYPEGENWPKSRHWSNVRASSKVSVQQSLLRGINRCVSRSVTGISRDIIHYSYCIGTVVSHLASRRGLCLSVGIDRPCRWSAKLVRHSADVFSADKFIHLCKIEKY